MARRFGAIASTVAALFTAAVLIAPVANAEPPGIPTASAARSQLAAIPTRAPGSMAGYSREKFPHWHTVTGACDTRETVLERDGTDVQTGSDCAPTAGRWFSPYDGATWTRPEDVDIDHVVPLAEAWRSGASGWSTERREDFANDLDGPQLITVTDNVNQSKGDRTPETWKPSETGYWCTYARMWIGSKATRGLSVSSSEKAALTDVLDRC